MESEKRDKYKEKHDVNCGGKWEHNKSEKYRTWLEILYDGVSYDVTTVSPKFGINMEAGYHRIHTLGHDPIAGGLFDTINIISDTITLEDLRTYKIANEPRPKHWDYQTLYEDNPITYSIYRTGQVDGKKEGYVEASNEYEQKLKIII